MWERFNEGARAAIYYADEEAKKGEPGFVETEHLLLGVLRDPTREVLQVLAAVGHSAEDLAAGVRLELPPRLLGNPTSQMTLTPAAQRALTLGNRAAKEMADGTVGAEHLLLGIVASRSGLGWRVLDKLGVTADALKLAMLRLNE